MDAYNEAKGKYPKIRWEYDTAGEARCSWHQLADGTEPEFSLNVQLNSPTIVATRIRVEHSKAMARVAKAVVPLETVVPAPGVVYSAEDFGFALESERETPSALSAVGEMAAVSTAAAFSAERPSAPSAVREMAAVSTAAATSAERPSAPSAVREMAAVSTAAAFSAERPSAPSAVREMAAVSTAAAFSAERPSAPSAVGEMAAAPTVAGTPQALFPIFNKASLSVTSGSQESSASIGDPSPEPTSEERERLGAFEMPNMHGWTRVVFWNGSTNDTFADGERTLYFAPDSMKLKSFTRMERAVEIHGGVGAPVTEKECTTEGGWTLQSFCDEVGIVLPLQVATVKGASAYEGAACVLMDPSLLQNSKYPYFKGSGFQHLRDVLLDSSSMGLLGVNFDAKQFTHEQWYRSFWRPSYQTEPIGDKLTIGCTRGRYWDAVIRALVDKNIVRKEPWKVLKGGSVVQADIVSGSLPHGSELECKWAAVSEDWPPAANEKSKRIRVQIPYTTAEMHRHRDRLPLVLFVGTQPLVSGEGVVSWEGCSVRIFYGVLTRHLNVQKRLSPHSPYSASISKQIPVSSLHGRSMEFVTHVELGKVLLENGLTEANFCL